MLGPSVRQGGHYQSLHDVTTLARGKRRQPESVRAQPAENKVFKVVVDGDDGGVGMRQEYSRIEAALEMRRRYKGMKPINAQMLLKRISPQASVACNSGIYHIEDHDPRLFYNMHGWLSFAEDAQQIRLTIGNTGCARACSHRLNILQERSKTFFLLNNAVEEEHTFRKAGGVLSGATKVDNSVKMSHALCAQELLELVFDTYQRFPDEVLGRNADGRQEVTLRELFEGYGVSDPRVLTIEALSWHPSLRARTHTAGEGDGALESLGDALVRTFLRPDGAFTPKVMRRILSRANNSSGTRHAHATEYALPIYGVNSNEIADIALFLKRNEIGPSSRNMWMLQLRLYDTPPEGTVVEAETVQQQLDAIFLPMINATLDAEDQRSTNVAWLLPQVGGLVIESVNPPPSNDFSPVHRAPSKMRCSSKPSILYYCFYIHQNLQVLNSLRLRKGMNTLQLRISGVHTALNTVAAAFLFADVMTQAKALPQFPVAEYLFGMERVGVTVSPLRDNATGTPYAKHPLPLMLHRCLTVAVATEEPSRYHHDYNPLREELATAQKLFHFTALDVAELGRNSILLSSFPSSVKAEWLGVGHAQGSEGNNFTLSEVTDMRIKFREETWAGELQMLKDLRRQQNKVTALVAGGVGGGAMSSISGAAGGATTSASSITGNTNQAASSARRKSVLDRTAAIPSVSRWHYLSTVEDVEYFTVLDSRIRFPRTVISGPMKEDKSAQKAVPFVADALKLRQKYSWEKPSPWKARPAQDLESDFRRNANGFSEDDWVYESRDSVFVPYRRGDVRAWPKGLPTIDEFGEDIDYIRRICDSIEVKEFALRRLELLEHKFMLHLALNHANEAGTTESQASTNRDIYQAVKVDTHIHMAAGMTPRQVLQFLKQKMVSNPNDIVSKKGDNVQTLSSVLKSTGINENLTVDQLNVQADYTLFERFDNFNNKYNPMANPDLRTLLLKTENYMNGRYFAELIHMCFDSYKTDKATYAENRLSIYGINENEWGKLAGWFDTHGMASKHNKWIIQIPRVYKVFRSNNVIGSFHQFLHNIFKPLWEASMHPSKYPSIHNFLKHVSGFDSVDNEATIDRPFRPVQPTEWTTADNPPYNYYLYYFFANIRTLNEFRARRGFCTFDFRPHCGESGADDHLHGAFLTADGICHGINLKNDPSIQYLYYLTQIGLHVSPLSNNALFVRFLNNPFPILFRRGISVSLSTDDPLIFHQTEEPLIEEYSVAARVWGLSPNDLCEIARYSVLHSGFDDAFKRASIGDRWYMSSSLGNDPHRTHLSDIRVAYRFETYHTELAFLESVCGYNIPRAMRTSHQEQEISEWEHQREPEEILLSTRDQAMETAHREIEVKRAQLQAVKRRYEEQLRNEKILTAQLADLATRKTEAAKEKAAKRQPVTYVRESPRRLPAPPTREGSSSSSSYLNTVSSPRRGGGGEEGGVVRPLPPTPPPSSRPSP